MKKLNFRVLMAELEKLNRARKRARKRREKGRAEDGGTFSLLRLESLKRKRKKGKGG